MSQRRPLPYTPHRPGAVGEQRPAGADYTRQSALPLRIGLPTPHKAWNQAPEFEQELQAIQAGSGGAAPAGLAEQDDAQDRSPVIVRSPRRSRAGPTIMGEISAGPLGAVLSRNAEPQDAPLSQGLPPVGSVLLCLQRAKVRSACGLLSEEVGYTEVGESLVVQQAVLNEYGQVRICFERGWTSVSAGDGTPLLGPPDAAPPAYAQPAAGGAAPSRIQPGDTCRVLARCIFRADCEM